MSEKKRATISSYRLPADIKSKLKTLAALDKATETAAIKRLIRAEYKARATDIRAFRANQKENQKKS